MIFEALQSELVGFDFYGVYHNQKIGINFQEKVSEETADYSIDQM